MKNSTSSKLKSQRGVTLIEMLVVVVIMGLFAALVVPSLFGRVDETKVTATRTQMESFATALGAYKLATGDFPSTVEGLQALRAKPDGVERWNGPYLPKDVPQDAWGHPYLYRFPGEHGDEPDIVSLGADGREGGEGKNADIGSWSK